MKKSSLKGLKSQLLKQLAFLMAICYLLHPLHRQFKTVFHELAHALEAPTNLLEHGDDGSHNSTHLEHKHQLGQTNHEHQLLEIWDSFFKKSNSKPPAETLVDKFSIDKHLTIDSNWIDTLVKATTKNKFWTHPYKLRDGHCKKRPDPPKHFIKMG